ncbi:MAG: hypothetical protein EPN20_00025, partial [Magnetospirillum sp.]
MDPIYQLGGYRLSRAWTSVAMLFAAGFGYGVYYIWYATTHLGIAPHFYQFNYDAAVMLACGKGYHAAPLDQVPGLRDFLNVATDVFDCRNIPNNLTLNPPTHWQRFYLYLLPVIAMLWKLTGVSWSALWPYYGVLMGATTLAVYAFFRVGMGGRLATVMAAILLLSNTYRDIFPHHYYFIKAVFIFGCLAVMGRMIVTPGDGRRLIKRAAVLGMIMGLSLGFRRDLMVLVPLVTVVVLFSLPGNPLRNLRFSLPALAAFAIGFAVLGGPIIETLSEGSNTGHIATLGLSTLFSGEMKIHPSFYDWGETYNDSMTRYMLNISSWINLGNLSELHIGEHEYDVAGVNYVMMVARHFPADIFLRGLAALKVDSAVFRLGEFEFGSRFSHILIALPSFLLAMRNLRAGLLAALVFFYLGTYPALLFRSSDYFYLAFMALFGFGVVLQLAVNLVIARPLLGKESGSSVPRHGPVLRNGAIFALVVVMALAGGLWVLRTYQIYHLRHDFFPRFDDAGMMVVEPVAVRTEGNSVAYDFDFFDGHPVGESVKRGIEIEFAYVVAQFDRKTCGV